MSLKQRIALRLQHLPFAVILLVDNQAVQLAHTWSQLGSPLLMQVVLTTQTNAHRHASAQAVQRQDHVAVIRILDAGQAPNCTSVIGTARHVERVLATAASAGFFYSAFLLLHAWAGLNIARRHGRASLHVAFSENSPTTVQKVSCGSRHLVPELVQGSASRDCSYLLIETLLDHGTGHG